ncbi:unnamed protein product [Adineta steineri]|uniref:Uncharacterized protein n=1 Tax=Adineta steineri TaxID=433720 RepID=A0A814Q0K3_9BILA|nr:unnamed protein product [Adineta steineri]CAF4031868.1 unnamed protein product [Adineta steineri]
MAIPSNEQISSGIKIYFNHPWYLLKTEFFILMWIILGFHLELIGSTLPILGQNINVGYTGMGSVLASRAVGYLVANLLGIRLQNITKKYAEALLICAFMLAAIVVFLTPFVKSLVVMWILFFIQGVTQSLTLIAGTHILLTMWGVNATVPLNAVHIGYGIGAVFANLLVRPFLNGEVSSMNIPNSEITNSTSVPVIILKTYSSIFIPYLITSILCVLIAIGNVYFYLHESRNQREKLEIKQADYGTLTNDITDIIDTNDTKISSPYSPRTFGNGDYRYGLTLTIIFVSYAFFMGANDQTFSKFFFSYLTFKEFHISDRIASWGIILYWTSMSIGRLIAAILSSFLSINTCFNILWTGGLCLIIAWLSFVFIIGLTTTSLLILGAFSGLIFGPIFPLTCGLINQRLNAVPALIALIFSGSAVGAIIFQQIAGITLDHDPNDFPILLAFFVLMLIILYTASNLIYHFHQRRNLENTRSSLTNGAALARESLTDEELPMINYPRDQNNQ